jgi:hypothetical protein
MTRRTRIIHESIATNETLNATIVTILRFWQRLKRVLATFARKISLFFEKPRLSGFWTEGGVKNKSKKDIGMCMMDTRIFASYTLHT